jgi:hypothetical protein
LSAWHLLTLHKHVLTACLCHTAPDNKDGFAHIKSLTTGSLPPWNTDVLNADGVPESMCQELRSKKAKWAATQGHVSWTKGRATAFKTVFAQWSQDVPGAQRAAVSAVATPGKLLFQALSIVGSIDWQHGLFKCWHRSLSVSP